MNFKTTYWLFGAFVVVLATLGLILWLGPSGSGDINYVIASLHDPAEPVSSNDIDTVEIERFRPEAEKLVFVRDPDSKNWRMTEPHPVRVNRFDVDHLVEQVRDARKYENVDLTSNLADWELDSPAATITLK